MTSDTLTLSMQDSDKMSFKQRLDTESMKSLSLRVQGVDLGRLLSSILKKLEKKYLWTISANLFFWILLVEHYPQFQYLLC